MTKSLRAKNTRKNARVTSPWVARIRILPVLILVAFMSFSIRLVDFATGLRTFNGSAHAEDKKDKSDVSMPSQDALKSGENKADTKPDAKGAAAKAEEIDEKMDEKSGNWRDASEDEVEFSPITSEVFEDLAKRRKQLDAREQEMMTREALLKAAEQELDRKYQELSRLRTSLEGLLEQQSEQEEARIVSLVKIYENMKPKDAARIFDTLDLDILVSVMSRMSERKLSPILAAMNPERARTITIMLAEQKQLPDLLGN